MKTIRKALILLLLAGVVLLLVCVVAAATWLLVGAAGESQELSKDLVMNLVVSKVDDHPPIDAVVERIPNDCLECHNDRHYGQEDSQ